MEIRLTAVQFAEIERRFGRELRYANWFGQATVKSRTADVMLPAIGWLRLRDQIASVAFNMRGQRSSNAPRHLTRGLSRIARALAELHMHPALQGFGLEGLHGQVIPTWNRPGRPRSEFPVADGTFEVLVPRPQYSHGLEFTVWEPASLFVVPSMPLTNEAEHLAFGLYTDE